MNARHAIAAAALFLVAGCAQAPTVPAADAPSAPSFQVRSTDQTDDFGMTTTSFDGATSTETAPTDSTDSTAEGGLTVGSGN